jgi:hypothetical protein
MAGRLVQNTGEFIVVRLDGAPEADHGPVRLLGTFPDLGLLEIALRAWPHHHQVTAIRQEAAGGWCNR